MAFEHKSLTALIEQDFLDLIAAERRESSILEYKSELYEPNDHGSREFLLDVCMFANASGGTVLIGIPELRDAENKPTGLPDSQAPLGVNCPNPEHTLLALEARIVEAIDERLPVELSAIPCDNNKFVLAVRVPNSLAKPHRRSVQGPYLLPKSA
jgi:predicted HTH transcriptional regulator